MTFAATRYVPLALNTPKRLPKFKEDFLVQRHISGKIFVKIQSVVLGEVLKRQINKQTDRQTDSSPGNAIS